jgi:5-methylthioadenosine/S-adenosylhomocysteine deaminase
MISGDLLKIAESPCFCENLRAMKKLFLCFFVLLLNLTAFSQQKTPVDLIVRGGSVVTMDAQKRVVENGAIAVKDGKIVAVGKADEIARQFTAKQIVEAQGKAVIPGLINTHTHAPMSLFRGIADDLDLNEWLTKYIFPAEAKNVNEQFVRAGTRLALAEMIRGGTTTYCDMYYFEDAIADETAKAGVRGVLGETIIRFPVADNKTPEEAIAYTERFVNKWRNHRLIVPAFAPHAPYTLTEESLRTIRRSADKLNATVVIHVAETRKEVEDVSKEHGARPVEYLARINFLNNKTIAAHVVFANDNELDILKRLNVGVAHNPSSNMKLASGVAPVPQMLLKDVSVGLGTDGAASNNDLSMWEEMDTAAKLHKLMSNDPKVVSAEQAFEMATIRGARALHLEKEIGSLEAGKRADIVIVDLDNFNQIPMYNIFSHLVYATKANDVRHVIIEGKLIMQDRRLLTLDEKVIKAETVAFQKQIVSSLKTK